jgi:hypothetical protein
MSCYKLQEEAAELEEILAKRQKRGKQVDDKPLEEKTVLHSKQNITILYVKLSGHEKYGPLLI